MCLPIFGQMENATKSVLQQREYNQNAKIIMINGKFQKAFAILIYKKI